MTGAIIPKITLGKPTKIIKARSRGWGVGSGVAGGGISSDLARP
jgi:hypothetical protein